MDARTSTYDMGERAAIDVVMTRKPSESMSRVVEANQLDATRVVVLGDAIPRTADAYSRWVDSVGAASLRPRDGGDHDLLTLIATTPSSFAAAANLAREAPGSVIAVCGTDRWAKGETASPTLWSKECEAFEFILSLLASTTNRIGVDYWDFAQLPHKVFEVDAYRLQDAHDVLVALPKGSMQSYGLMVPDLPITEVERLISALTGTDDRPCCVIGWNGAADGDGVLLARGRS